MEAALAALAADGFDARRNGHGLLVRVDTGRRAAPVAALLRAQIPVLDLRLEDDAWTD